MFHLFPGHILHLHLLRPEILDFHDLRHLHLCNCCFLRVRRNITFRNRQIGFATNPEPGIFLAWISWDFWAWICLLLLLGVHVVEVLAVLLGYHLEPGGLHVVHPRVGVLGVGVEMVEVKLQVQTNAALVIR